MMRVLSTHILFTTKRASSFYVSSLHQQWRRNYHRQEGNNEFKRFKDRRDAGSSNSPGNILRTPLIYRSLAGLSIVSLIYYYSNLRWVPVSSDYRFITVPDEKEQKIGLEAVKQIMERYKGKLLNPMHPASMRVNGVVNRLLSAIPESNYRDFVKKWTAMAIPGGYIIVFTGILEQLPSDDTLASVLGHEMSHVLLRHGIQALSLEYSKWALIGAITLLFGVPFDLLRISTALSMDLPYSRLREEEADYYGLMLTAEACYEPMEAIKFWQIMKQRDADSFFNGSRVGNILSTHPMHEDRIQKLNEAMPEAYRRKELKGCQETRRLFNDFDRVVFDQKPWK